MTEPDDMPIPDSANLPVAVTDSPSSPFTSSSADTNAQTLIQKTISESGNESAETRAAKSGAVTVGSKLGPYHLVRKLGQGGHGSRL